MGHVKTPSLVAQPGWRRDGLINILLISVCSIVLLIYFAIRISKSRDLSQGDIIYEGDRRSTERLDRILHLLLNLLSTIVAASSSFFMRILSSPSRSEVDHAHSKLCSLDIGISSTKNLDFVSPLKRTLWALLVIVSVPMHLFFNSTVFATGYQGAYYNITIGAEPFIHGANYSLPGASSANQRALSSLSADYEALGKGLYDFGDTSDEADARRRLDAAIESARTWDRISPQRCRDEYQTHKARQNYRDVLIIVDPGTKDGMGWAEADDPYHTSVPAVVNPLWFSAQCRIWRYAPRRLNRILHRNTCAGALGQQHSYGWLDSQGYPLNTKLENKTSNTSEWVLQFARPIRSDMKEQYILHNYENEVYELDVKFCLAEPSPYRSMYKVVVHNLLLLVVIIFLILKIGLCTIVLFSLSQPSLVTIGDATESFITNPDPVTLGLGTLDIVDSWELQREAPRHLTPSENGEGTDLQTRIKPRQWKRSGPKRRLMHTISRSMWTRTYSAVAVSIFLLIMSIICARISSPGGFSLSSEELSEDRVLWGRSGFIMMLLFANLPQLLLSLSYFAYDALFTQLVNELEWNSYSLEYKPLRVSYPSGGQLPTYRFQLPIKYSLFLISASVVAHWLLSSALFVFVMDGGYWNSPFEFKDKSYFRVSEDAVVALGYSVPAILALLATISVVALVPWVFSLTRLQGNMVAGCSDSLVISASCHCSLSAPSNTESDGDQSQASASIVYEALPEVSDGNAVKKRLEHLSRSKLKWGAQPLSPHLVHILGEDSPGVKHLGFGIESDGVSSPLEVEAYI